MADYVNIQGAEARSAAQEREESDSAGFKVYRLVAVSFGLLCILQSLLNISLRLQAYHIDAPDHMTSYNQCISDLHAGEADNKLRHCVTALIKDKDMLRIKVDQQEDEIKSLQEERNRLQKMFSELEHHAQSCSCGWMGHLSSCYWISFGTKTWEEAELDCVAKRAHMVIINSKEEQNWLSTLDDAEDKVWIGLRDESVSGSGRWTWVDGTHLSFHQWDVLQPDDPDTSTSDPADCVYSDRYRIGKWHNAPCNETHRWICEKVRK